MSCASNHASLSTLTLSPPGRTDLTTHQHMSTQHSTHLAVSRMDRFPARHAPRTWGGSRDIWSCMREMSGEMTTTSWPGGLMAATVW